MACFLRSAAFVLFSSCSLLAAFSLPAQRRTAWAPGVPGGIPVRTKICATLFATQFGNGSTDARTGIQNSLDACPDGEVVVLDSGEFALSGPVQLRHTVVLRGRGPERTVLRMAPSGTSEPLVIVGTRWFKNTQSTSLARDALKGDSSVELSKALPLSPGELVLVDQITDTNLVRWGSRSPTGDVSRTWFTRPDRPLGQVLEVASVSGKLVRFTTPLHIGFATSFQAALSRYSQAPEGDPVPSVRFAGIEDLRLTGGGNGNLHFENAAYSWARNIESDHQNGEALSLNGSFRCTIRDSYLHSTVNPFPGGGGYGFSFASYSSDNLLENNIVWNMNKVMVMRASGGGNVIAYNYMDDGIIGYDLDWVEVGLNASHMACPHYELFEGNLSFNFDGDNTWGNAIHVTAFRNHLTAKRVSYDTFRLVDRSNRRAIGLMEGHWWYNFVGNVLGTPGMDPAPNAGFQIESGAPWVHDSASIWKLGYNPENWDAPADPKVLSTVLRHGNRVLLNNTLRWDPGLADHDLPASLYRITKPDFFGDLPWPWVDPVAAPHVGQLPAKIRMDRRMGRTTTVTTPLPAGRSAPSLRFAGERALLLVQAPGTTPGGRLVLRDARGRVERELFPSTVEGSRRLLVTLDRPLPAGVYTWRWVGVGEGILLAP